MLNRLNEIIMKKQKSLDAENIDETIKIIIKEQCFAHKGVQ